MGLIPGVALNPAYYQELSKKLLKEAHPDWSPTQIAQEADESQFNKAALEFFVETLRTCRALRPN